MTYPGIYPSSSPIRYGEADTGFYVGPIGSMIRLPDVWSPVTVPLARIGGTGVSLEGNQWRDTLGYRRSWTWAWANLLPAHTAYVEALSCGLVRGPLRLIDPHRANRLPEQVAAGGSRARSPAGFAVTAGGLTYRDLRAVSADPTTLPPVGLLRGCQEWQRPAGGAGTCYLDGDEADGTWRLPLTDRGDILELSCWVAGNAAVPVELAWTEYDMDDTAHPYFAAGDGSEDLTLSASGWQRLSLLVDPATRPAVALTPRLTVPAGAPAGSVLHTAWQIAATDAEQLPAGAWSGGCEVPELAGGWRVGGGAPVVVVDPGTATYQRPGFRDLGLTLTET